MSISEELAKQNFYSVTALARVNLHLEVPQDKAHKIEGHVRELLGEMLSNTQRVDIKVKKIDYIKDYHYHHRTDRSKSPCEVCQEPTNLYVFLSTGATPRRKQEVTNLDDHHGALSSLGCNFRICKDCISDFLCLLSAGGVNAIHDLFPDLYGPYYSQDRVSKCRDNLTKRKEKLIEPESTIVDRVGQGENLLDKVPEKDAPA